MDQPTAGVEGEISAAGWLQGIGWRSGADAQGAQTIPADFAQNWGEWCGEAGVKGKFSMIPYPAGVARIDQGLPGFPRHEFDAWMDAYRNLIQPNLDITCEMLTHTQVIDLKTWQFTDAWEQYEWVDPPVEPSLELLTDYIATAMQICRDAGLSCEGVTSPGAFGSKQEAAYAKATLDAALRVNGDKRPFYFLHVADARTTGSARGRVTMRATPISLSQRICKVDV